MQQRRTQFLPPLLARVAWKWCDVTLGRDALGLGILALICVLSVAHAQTASRTFIGRASLVNVHKGVAGVTADVNVTISDVGGAGIVKPAAILSLSHRTSRASIPLLPVSSSGASLAMFRATLSMTLAEYSQWRLGPSPELQFSYRRSDGRVASTRIVLQVAGLTGGAIK
jgi:hypothetical protein